MTSSGSSKKEAEEMTCIHDIIIHRDATPHHPKAQAVRGQDTETRKMGNYSETSHSHPGTISIDLE